MPIVEGQEMQAWFFKDADHLAKQDVNLAGALNHDGVEPRSGAKEQEDRHHEPHAEKGHNAAR
jgi:hypothetical protein